MSNNVEHPSHYNQGKYEVIDVINDWKLNFNLGNAIKYIARADYKNNAIEDLEKAIFYLNYEINFRKNLEESFKKNEKIEEDFNLGKELFKYFFETILTNEEKIKLKSLKIYSQYKNLNNTHNSHNKNTNKNLLNRRRKVWKKQF